MSIKYKIVFLLILGLAFVLRFYRLNDHPALNADEAAVGYNAYSLLETGKDEHGNPWPIHFQSFNDYKPGLYFYLVLPFVKLFGLNEWSVRIPGALLGVGTVHLIFLLARDLSSRLKEDSLLATHFPLLSAALLAITPWHIHFSRGAWEVNVATFFITLGVWLFLKSLYNRKYFVLCALSFVPSLYTYHAARVIVPLLGSGILMIYSNELKKNLKWVTTAILICGLLLSPLAMDMLKPGAVSRAAGVGLFADVGPLNRINEQRGEHQDFDGFTTKVLHNKAVNYGLAFLENWASHYHGLFLFLSGDDIQRNKVPETGQLYIFSLLLLVVGCWSIFRRPSRSWLFIVWWLIVAPSAAALTFQSPHALRAQNMVIPLTIISAYGLVKLIEWGKNSLEDKQLLTTYILFLTAILVWELARYQHMYWVHMAKEYPFSSQYGIKELVTHVESKKDKYEKIIITDRYDQPYILFLFYTKYSPEIFQGGHELTPRDRFGFSTVRNFDKYEFRLINFDTDQPENPGSLLIGTDEEIPDEANVVEEIYGSNGYKYFQVVAN